jgi:hypothetical protein
MLREPQESLQKDTVMASHVGSMVIDVLETAGSRFLQPSAPKTFQIFMLHVGGGSSLKVYEPGSLYWRRVQILLDTFFTGTQRAEICGELLARLDLDRRLESLDFAASALAERRLQEMLSAPGSALAQRMQSSTR